LAIFELVSISSRIHVQEYRSFDKVFSDLIENGGTQLGILIVVSATVSMVLFVFGVLHFVKCGRNITTNELMKYTAMMKQKRVSDPENGHSGGGGGGGGHRTITKEGVDGMFHRTPAPLNFVNIYDQGLWNNISQVLLPSLFERLGRPQSQHKKQTTMQEEEQSSNKSHNRLNNH